MAQPYPISRESREEDIFFGDGGKVYGPFDLKIFDGVDVQVWTLLDGATDWQKQAPTIVKTSDEAFDTFSIEFAANQLATTKIKVLSARVHERTAGVTQGTQLSPDALEKELTKQGTILQELRRDIGRALVSPFGQPGQQLPEPDDGKVIGWAAGKLANVTPAAVDVLMTSTAVDLVQLGSEQAMRDFLQISTEAEIADDIADAVAGVRAPREWPPGPEGVVTLDDDGYSHFGVQQAAYDRLVCLYRDNGVQHDYAAHEGVCLSQQPAAPGAQTLAINGTHASGGTVHLGAPTEVTIFSTADDTGVTFTITGSLDGVPVVLSEAGPDGSVPATARKTLVGKVDTIDLNGVAVSGPTSGDIQVGLAVVPQDIAARWSKDVWRTISGKVTVFDGKTDGLNAYYWPALGRCANGDMIAVCTEIDIETGATRPVFKKSRDGAVYDEDPTEIVITGDVPGRCQWFGKIATTPAGKLVACCYDRTNLAETKVYVLTSSDDGAHMVSKLILTGGATQYSEACPAVIDDNNWIVIVRIDNVVGSLKQFKTTDGGANYTDQGATNLPPTGGYKSHDLTGFYVDGVLWLALTFMIRYSVSGTAEVYDCIAYMAARAKDVLASALNWGGQHILETGLEDLSGYPSVVVDPVTRQAVMTYGKETDPFYAARMLAKRVPITSRAIGDDDIATFTPVLLGTGGTQPAYTTQVGRAYKRGKHVHVSGNIVVNGAISLTGNLSIGGLPYTVATPNTDSGRARTSNRVAPTAAPAVYGVADTKTLAIWHDTDTGYSFLASTEVSSNFQISFSIAYLTND